MRYVPLSFPFLAVFSVLFVAHSNFLDKPSSSFQYVNAGVPRLKKNTQISCGLIIEELA